MDGFVKCLFIFGILISGCNGSSQQGKNKSGISFTIKGSDTVLPVAQKETEEFLKEFPESSISIVGGGTGVGISALMESTANIAMASREMKPEEIFRFKEKDIVIREICIGYDALAIICHPDNKIEKITREEIEDIFIGKITNWKELGGDNLPIVPYSRESSSGTYELFKELCLNNKNYHQKVLNMPATGSIIQAVSQTKGAIGYVGMAYLDPKVKTLHISLDQGKTYWLPSPENSKNKTYPVIRPLYFYYKISEEENLKRFIDFVMSEKGQELVLQAGYIPAGNEGMKE